MQTVFITGCAQGIGAHLAQRFYEKGYQVVATDLDIERLRQHTQHWDAERTLVERLDVRQASDWQAVLSQALGRFGRIDVGINNAGVIVPGFLFQTTPQSIDLQVDVNLKGVMLGSQILGQHMAQQGQGHLINIASLAGVAPIHGLGVYSATKFAVRAFTLAISHELRQQGVWVSCICPHLVNTQMLDIQLHEPSAAITFSGNKVLDVRDIERAVFERALQQRTLEILVPRWAGWQGKLANLWPGLAQFLTEKFTQKGLQNQLTWQARRQQ
jgi:3-oxoacyl-[acyl-carrier protein] reductase